MLWSQRIVGGVMVALLITTSAVAQQKTPQPCSDPQQKQFDFWVGEWDLTSAGPNGSKVAQGTNSVHRIMDGCVVQENFSSGDTGPLRGMSLSMFEPQSGKWKQTWVDNQGAYMDFVGEFKDGQMVLAREATGPGGSKFLQRMVYKNIGANEFDWSWEASRDGGTTWTVKWPLHYKRNAS